MLRPNFEDPFDTAQQLVDNNITLFDSPGSHIWKQLLAQSSIPAYNKLSETMIITEEDNEFWNYMEHYVIGKGTHVLLTSYRAPWELSLGRWYRSKDRVSLSINPYAGYLSNKKWYLNEVSFSPKLQNQNNIFPIY